MSQTPKKSNPMLVPSLKAIVIGAISYSDSSKVVKVLTQEYGILPVFVRVSKKTSVLWHPLATLELSEVKRKNSNSLATFKGVERASSAIETLRDPKRTALAFFLSEFLEKSVPEGTHIDGVFDVIEEAVCLLENDKHVANLHFYAIAKVILALGLMPENTGDSSHSLHLETGEWHDVKPLLSKTSYLLKYDLAELMIKIPGMDFVNIRNLRLNQNERKELLLAMVMFIQLHHAGLREIKSYEVLETIFD
ncbi:MAG: hypothetical protein CL847_03460 [Crocinitomicaceae bacterium]|nr:hypothetical protein [Crocinitomicaceae bacterium]